MKYHVVKTKVGYAVQNTKTFAIVNVYKNEAKAIEVCRNLNMGYNEPRVYVIAA